MTTTWLLTRVLPVIAFFLLVAAVAWLGGKVKSRLSPTVPVEDGGADEGREDPVEHEGASEEWGAKLHAIAEDMKLHPGFVEEAEAMAAEDARYAGWIEECRDRLYLAGEHFAREYSRALEKFDESANATGQLYDVRELDALLAVA